MKLTKFGLILVGIYALITIAILGYSEFICKPDALGKFDGGDRRDELISCRMAGVLPTLPWMLLWLIFTMDLPIPLYFSWWSGYILSFSVNSILIYFLGLVTEKIFVDSITKRR